jgi:hypothetical protein
MERSVYFAYNEAADLGEIRRVVLANAAYSRPTPA